MHSKATNLKLFSETPLLACVDIQKEYVTPGQRQVMADVDDVLNACVRVMNTWRKELWPIAHLKRMAPSTRFNSSNALTDWLETVRPCPGELVFEHPMASAYSSPRFANYLRELGRSHIFIVGFSLEEAVLATAVEGFHRGHNVSIISGAVASRHSECCDAALYRQVVLELISNYATLQAVDDILASVTSVYGGTP
ncbi:MAG: hypothetical protein QOJ96_3013 [Alphaproteobacteria bacterium]|jgi:nicotinamidase-related amidase|nr:hypothetical protein [Alphaproteobacteria bacterium]